MTTNQATYQVLVGNVGTVYSGLDGVEAVQTYMIYIDRSNMGGRAYGETVTLIREGEIVREHIGWVDQQAD